MGGRALEPSRLDVETFAAEGGRLGGTWALDELVRLRESTLSIDDMPASASIDWRVSGEQRPAPGRPETWLHLSAGATLPLQCQRCLGPVAVPVEVDRDLRFVHGEDAASALDADSEDDVLALSPALDLKALVEDELLLALPLVPRHDVCPEPLSRPPEDVADAPNPFAALAALKRGRATN